MNRISSCFLFLSFFSLSVYSQTSDLLSLTVSSTRSAGYSFGTEFEYQSEIRNGIYFIVGTGYNIWNKVYEDRDLKINLQTDVNWNEKVNFVPVIIGLNYYFGESSVKPFIAVNWAINFSTVHKYKYFAYDPLVTQPKQREFIKSESIIELTYGIGLGFLYELSENLGGKFSFNPNLGGEYSSGMRFMIGVVYSI